MKPRQPSELSISKAFPTNNAHYVRQLLTDDNAVENDPAVKAWVNQCYHLPSIEEQRACALNAALEMYGIEYIGGKRPFCYLNTGDPYLVTLIRYQDSKSWFIGNWGDIVERGGY